MRQVIRYEVEVFFLKSNLDLATLVIGPGRCCQLPYLGVGTPKEWRCRCPVLTGNGNLHP